MNSLISARLHSLRHILLTFIICLPSCSQPGCDSSKKPSSHIAAPDSTKAKLAQRFKDAIAAKGSNYIPRTRHKNSDGTPKFTNRLIFESSPYLLQHAHNPVDWRSWGDEAFDEAERLKRPIFLSIGYSTCHWCHVMEEESFEDEAIARYLNENYIAIKVDREERPDVDAVYMSFVQAFTGSGGWPMNVWLTSKREPFFGGTYFPPHAGISGSRKSFTDVLEEQSKRYSDDPGAVAAAAHNMAARLQKVSAPEVAGAFPPASILKAARDQAEQGFDPQFGGRRGAPKFPSSFPMRHMLRYAHRSNDTKAKQMTLLTLQQMRSGGIFDQVGGGFHRYSTDASWLTPHFEKMLYDNAILAITYLEASQTSSDPIFGKTTRDILDYLLREMTAPDGTFYSATDADSPTGKGHNEEWIFYTWTPNELQAGLSAEENQIATAWYQISASGNFEGRTILSTPSSLQDVAQSLNIDESLLEKKIIDINVRLLQKRTERLPPLRDEKIIVAWNALTISALARAALVFGESRYQTAALRAANALVSPLRAGRPLPHLFTGGKEQGLAFSDDHVLLANALLDVFELTGDIKWLHDAKALMAALEKNFSDPNHGGYFLSSKQHEQLLVKEKPTYDGPIPNVNSVAAQLYLRLYSLTDQEIFQKRAETTLGAFSNTLNTRPLALDQMLLALDWATDSVKEILILIPEGQGALSPAARPLLDVLQSSLLPNAVIVVLNERQISAQLSEEIPWVKNKVLRNGQTTAYVCERGSCRLPTSDPAVFKTQLALTRPYP